MYLVEEGDNFIVFFRNRNNEWLQFIVSSSNEVHAKNIVRHHESLHKFNTIYKNGLILKKFDQCKIQTFLSHLYRIFGNITFCTSIKKTDRYAVYNKYLSTPIDYYFMGGSKTESGAKKILKNLLKYEYNSGAIDSNELYGYCKLQELVPNVLNAIDEYYCEAYRVK